MPALLNTKMYLQQGDRAAFLISLSKAMTFSGAYKARSSLVLLSSISIALCCIVVCFSQLRIFKLQDILTASILNGFV